ncbi:MULTISPECIES: helix-turn-helix domain-containing protein [unclassified Paenibacillus]|uniref:helix-turn-helix domain-containing protein n=1 Tax=unclassified Paenibacillus TaxID=185978 RepID=UPI0024071121|nr:MULTISPECIES: helix-turn-helix domain-containing protein [unclassified Paenibacillus]MDF9844809.1 AraC-like DNA-binding protein [Paenibacillus sp. PastF-2]MDF9851390.1 AraC-like DNA-binding protein [Paenibacillus sp. PastM-2]MDF9857993.1 AraC-like DNA-binding protein [Paenibacillus sp. PastF-1]MDH6483261.1 AraC-like DNA-binding protein [Paenibacillus sp. PastH-2]MDH6510671.1 AraC-like DNA-binding protein [Paenibacillus sp. PastM-3]
MERVQPLDISDTDTGERSGMAGIRAFMANHFHEPLSIDQLAAMAGFRPKYFSELFKKTYGQSAMDYLTDLRISRAKQYLQESGYLLREIAHKVGYSDEFYFSRKFKKETGVPPSAFLRRQKQRIAACSAAATGQLLALDIIPATAPLDAKWTHYYYNKYYSLIETHLRVDLLEQETEVDRLIRSRPDVIIGHAGMAGDWRESLLRNAQTLFIPGEQGRWDEQLLELAVFLDREQQYRQWLELYEQKAEQITHQVSKAVGRDKVIVLRLSGDQLYAYCNRGIKAVLYEQLGFCPAYNHSSELYNEPVSIDELQALNPQRLLLLICPDSRTRMSWLSLQHNERWCCLQAERNRQVYLLPSDPWFEYSAVAIDRMLEETQLMFTGNCPNPQEDRVHGYPQAYPI